MNITKWILFFVVSALCGLPPFIQLSSAAESTPKETMPETPEMRLQMADIHQNMAYCLRSNRATKECKADMMKSCHEAMGLRTCPMMEHSMMGAESSGEHKQVRTKKDANVK